jgi:GWxTD domain-containing protein
MIGVPMARGFRLSALALLAALAAACGTGTGAAPARSLADLTNPYLGPEYSGWLIGPIAGMVTPAETEAFLALRDDAGARELIEEFWRRRDPTPATPDNPLRQAFEERAAEADRLYSESGFLGRRTDRGAIFVLYGPPSRVDYEVSPSPGDPPLEVWFYTPDVPAGLHGKRPAGSYRFIRRGDLTRTYVPRRPGQRPGQRPGPPREPFGGEPPLD